MNQKADLYDLVQIGAGPAGADCAISAMHRSYHVPLINQGSVADAIIRFPTNRVFFSTSDQLELDGVPLTSQNMRPNRVKAAGYYRNLVRMFKIPVLLDAGVCEVKNNQRYSEKLTAKKLEA